MVNEAEKAPNIMEEPETPATFLTNLGKTLSEKEGVDADLTNILARHLLTTTPTKDAVALARDAIVKLAGERATPKPAVDNG